MSNEPPGLFSLKFLHKVSFCKRLRCVSNTVNRPMQRWWKKSQSRFFSKYEKLGVSIQMKMWAESKFTCSHLISKSSKPSSSIFDTWWSCFTLFDFSSIRVDKSSLLLGHTNDIVITVPLAEIPRFSWINQPAEIPTGTWTHKFADIDFLRDHKKSFIKSPQFKFELLTECLSSFLWRR